MGYGLFLAKVIAGCSEYSEDVGDRLQVRVIPYMESIDADKCPIWPYFFKDQLYTGSIGELVWVVCNDEFSTGYIMGPANYTTYEMDDYGKYSIPKSLKDTTNNVFIKLRGTSLGFDDVKITFWSSTCVHFIKRSTGAFIIAYSNGTMYYMGPDEMLINIGEFSLKMDSQTGLSVSASNIKLQSDYIGLGKNPEGNVLITKGASSKASIASAYVKA